MSARARDIWVSYLRVSTPEQAAKDLSLPAQREAVEEYARRNGQVIQREYLESGCSGTDINRKAFRLMLEDVLKPGSDIGTIVVHHTSRFTRNATQARVVKEQLRKQGVKVVSVSVKVVVGRDGHHAASLTEGFSGLRSTIFTGSQFLVSPDQRSGFLLFAAS